ncbi:right-handed parallel beta-helix repeat-containing protein [Paenibacillus spongiae]|uniref:Right-handed parallel beta-helix repeat-containing protein n=1 Tax=Paenibacillus spongiae TaxID=2909671 RepID=A0ABY5SC27_9BACL|nr:right-handed parallel beta-helix repeat-containing protein [Paenibacillus spongiae]UVI31511.1 right-handed parallel beta-helix repeat-containing protein [Paenibacillus spongiae]
MNRLWKWLLAGTLVLPIATSTSNAEAPVGISELNGAEAAVSAIASTSTYRKTYVVDLARWGITKDGTKAAETTRGINNALVWASSQGFTTTTLPTGTYLIDKNSRINMVSNMTFKLDDKTVIQKEKNGKERYETLYIGYGITNVKLQGGIYRGDKNTHDYSKKDNKYTAGTHESGYGIMTEGAENLSVEGIKAEYFTGDGMVIGGKGTLVKDIYASHFESGSFDAAGKRNVDKNSIRTKVPIPFTNPIFLNEQTFEVTNNINLPRTFDIYFYKSDNTFLTSIKNASVQKILQIPTGAAKFHLVFKKTVTAGTYVEVWNKTVSKNIVVKDSEFAFNRRQGITIGGGDQVQILNNVFHDMKGIAPQSGIDIEGGFGENGHRNTNIKIKDNEFYNNAAYDLILYDGWNAIVEGNHFASKGVIGLAVSPPFTGAVVRNNHFDGTRIVAYHDVTFIDNRMNDSYTFFEGPNVKIEKMTFTDSILAISSSTPFGVTATDITMYNNKKQESAVSVWKKPVRLSNVTIHGETKLNTIVGGVEDGSIFDNLQLLGHSGAGLPRGTYNNCVFESAQGNKRELVATSAGNYVFNGCKIKSDLTGLYLDNKASNFTVKDSTFEITGNSPAISVQAAKKVDLQNNSITANNLTQLTVPMIKLNDYWKRTERHDILAAAISGNQITTNIAAIGISTIYAGVGAPPYTVTNNSLKKAKLELKKNDVAAKNTLQ